MLAAEERRKRAASFGVPEAQIVRDHLISHVLQALAEQDALPVTFFGGTALCRTWLPGLRLSEDIDLLVEDHIEAAQTLPEILSRGIRREFPQARWRDLDRRNEVDTKSLELPDGSSVTVQFARWRHRWEGAIPTTVAPVELRYSDLADTCNLKVPHPSGFGAMKLIAWSDRHAARDLLDLHGLAQRGSINREGQKIHEALMGWKPTHRTLEPQVPQHVEEEWLNELGHQMKQPPSPGECLETVRDALRALEDDQGHA